MIETRNVKIFCQKCDCWRPLNEMRVQKYSTRNYLPVYVFFCNSGGNSGGHGCKHILLVVTKEKRVNFVKILEVIRRRVVDDGLP